MTRRSSPSKFIRSSKSRRAVTLVEAILVIIVLSLVAVAGLVTFDSEFTSRQSVAMETKHLGETLRGVRNTAIMNKTNIRVRRIRTQGGDHIEIDQLAGPLRPGRQTQVSIDSDLRVGGTSNWVNFRPDGTLSRSLRLIIRGGTVEGEVTVSPVNGSITTDLPTRS